MARTTISIPDELKSRMDAVAQTAEVNWSAVAARAFEQKIGQLAAERGVEEMQDVIERLRASKIEGEDEDYKAGYELGEDWAKHHAGYLELRRMDQCDWAQFFPDDSSFWSSAFSVGEHLAFIILGDENHEEHDRRDADETLEKLGLDEHQDDIAVLRGFVDGALGIYANVRKEL